MLTLKEKKMIDVIYNGPGDCKTVRLGDLSSGDFFAFDNSLYHIVDSRHTPSLYLVKRFLDDFNTTMCNDEEVVYVDVVIKWKERRVQ